MAQEDLALALRRVWIRRMVRLSELVICLGVDSGTLGDAAEVVIGIGVKAEDIMP